MSKRFNSLSISTRAARRGFKRSLKRRTAWVAIKMSPSGRQASPRSKVTTFAWGNRTFNSLCIFSTPIPKDLQFGFRHWGQGVSGGMTDGQWGQTYCLPAREKVMADEQRGQDRTRAHSTQRVTA